jgi:hypothetical protein
MSAIAPIATKLLNYSNGRHQQETSLGRKASRYAAGRQVCIPPFEQVEDAEGHGVVLAAVAEQVEHRETMGIRAMNVLACLIT